MSYLNIIKMETIIIFYLLGVTTAFLIGIAYGAKHTDKYGPIDMDYIKVIIFMSIFSWFSTLVFISRYLTEK